MNEALHHSVNLFPLFFTLHCRRNDVDVVSFLDDSADESRGTATERKQNSANIFRKAKQEAEAVLESAREHTDELIKDIEESTGGITAPNLFKAAPTPEALVSLIAEFTEKQNIPLDGIHSATVFVGRDTRPSGELLLEAAKQGIISVLRATAVDMGVLTTPQLHWLVRSRNKGMDALESYYFEQLSGSYRCLLDLIPVESLNDKVVEKVVVDGANGVGGEKLDHLKNMLSGLLIEVRNDGKNGGVVNDGVGADYVQKEKVTPLGFGPCDVGLRCASLDGDADRLVYFSIPSGNSNKIDLVDGDKILTLFALFIKEQLKILSEGIEELKGKHQTSVGVVQTAYANGASTDYLQELGLQVVFTPTGVKYLHEEAAQFDIGIYFEANGHGTILFSETFLSWLEAWSNELASMPAGSEQLKASLRLLAVSKLINQAVGDALSGLLLVEAILQYKGWSIHDWNKLYQDLPSRQLKVKVRDRTAVVTTNAETTAVSPAGIQEAIDAETAKYLKGRCFIRPSGTEDVVRIYAEASTQEEADALAKSVAALIDQFLGSGNTE